MPKPENGARKRILLVEDDADLRDLIAGRLTRAGYECAGAADGTEALAYITDNRPDALLLDQKLPDMTGRQLLENLAELGLGVPFMVMTGQGEARSDFDLINQLMAELTPELKADGVAGAFSEAVQLIKELDGVSSAQVPAAGLQWPVDASGAGTPRVALPTEEKAKFKFYAARL